jgi:hypothetical protein
LVKEDLWETTKLQTINGCSKKTRKEVTGVANLARVMVSSTVLDLPEHRYKVKEACLKLGVLPLMMEAMPASAADPMQESRKLGV